MFSTEDLIEKRDRLISRNEKDLCSVARVTNQSLQTLPTSPEDEILCNIKNCLNRCDPEMK